MHEAAAAAGSRHLRHVPHVTYRLKRFLVFGMKRSANTFPVQIIIVGQWLKSMLTLLKYLGRKMQMRQLMEERICDVKPIFTLQFNWEHFFFVIF